MSTPQQRERARRNIASYRRRQRAGLGILRIEVPVDDIALALLVSGTLTEEETSRRRDLERGAALVMTRWAKEWLRGHGEIL